VTIQKWIKGPKGYVTIALVSYLIIASIGSKNIMGIKNSIIAIGVALVVDSLYCGMKNRKSSKDSTVITGLIISLILSFTTPWQIVAGTAVIAILSKHLLVYKKKPIFNPATVGLLLSILIFQTGQSWWGAFGDLPAWTIIFLVIGGYLITDRVNKFPQVLSFLGTFFVLLFLMGLLNVGNAADAFRPPFINATLFFSFFMLTDPPTSPAKYKNQALFGILSAVPGVLVYGMFGGLTYLFIGLFIGNVYSYLNKRPSSNAAALRQNVKTTQQTRVSRRASR
jgi:Na+-translocating ferredoxin:NAD+ oxidoreductase RnfD subunit